jgi:cation:H+ antiporter
LKIPVFIIAATIVPIGTSMPELVVSVLAAIDGESIIAYGNVVGSNIANMSLGIAVIGIFFPTALSKHFIKDTLPVLTVFYLMIGFFLINYKLGMVEGIVILSMFSAYLYYIVKHQKPEESEDIGEPKYTKKGIAFAIFVASLIGLIISSKLLIWGAVEVAKSLNVSNLVISLTIVAVGTSLPEIVVSAVSAKKGHYGIAFGNIFGSNLYNLALVLPVSAIVSPIDITKVAFWRDYTAVLVSLALVLVFVYIFRNSKHQINKTLGIVLVGFYVAYNILIGIYG